MMYLNMPDSEYRDGSHFGIHAILDFAKLGPEYFYRRYILRELPEEGDQSAFDLGRAAHVLILEGVAKYHDAVAIRPEHYVDAKGNVKPWHASSNTCKDWKKNAEAEGKAILSGSDNGLLMRMRTAVFSNPDAVGLLASGGFPEVTFRREVTRMPLQCRADWIMGEPDDPLSWTGIVDLKTCADLNAFENSVWRFGYWWQAAFYRWMIEEHIYQLHAKRVSIPFYFVAVEKQGVHRVKCYRLPEAAYLLANGGSKGWQETLGRVLDCFENSNWPTGVEPGVHVIDMPEWVERKEGAVA